MTTSAIRPVAIKIDDAMKGRVKRLADARHRTAHWLMQEIGDRPRFSPCGGF